MSLTLFIIRKCAIGELVAIATHLKAEASYQDSDKKSTLRGIQTVFDAIAHVTQKLAMFDGLKPLLPAAQVPALERRTQ